MSDDQESTNPPGQPGEGTGTGGGTTKSGMRVGQPPLKGLCESLPEPADDPLLGDLDEASGRPLSYGLAGDDGKIPG